MGTCWRVRARASCRQCAQCHGLRARSLIIPPVVYLRLLGADISRLARCGVYALVTFGVVAMVLGTVQAVRATFSI